MKVFRMLIPVFLLLCSLLTWGEPVKAAAYDEYQGLQVMVNTDKETYQDGEAITAIITVVNTNSQPVTVMNLEQLIPEGYVLAENSEVSTQNVEIRPGQTIELQVTFEGEPEEAAEGSEGSFWDKVFYGETIGIPNLILIVFGVIFFIVFMALT